MYAEIAKIGSKNESSGCKIVKKGKEINICCGVTPQTAKAMAIMYGKCLVKMEKSLYLWIYV